MYHISHMSPVSAPPKRMSVMPQSGNLRICASKSRNVSISWLGRETVCSNTCLGLVWPCCSSLARLRWSFRASDLLKVGLQLTLCHSAQLSPYCPMEEGPYACWMRGWRFKLALRPAVLHRSRRRRGPLLDLVWSSRSRCCESF